jgi:hypothetical protein
MMARGPVERVRSIAATLPSDATREEIVHACIKKGINAHTARTQVSKYLVSQGRHTRRTKDEMTELRERIIQAVEENPEAVTVRGAYYRVAALTPPTETIVAYNTIQGLLVKLREEGRISFDKIIDPGSGLQGEGEDDFASHLGTYTSYTYMAKTYDRALWKDAAARPVITLEKEALARRVAEITGERQVPLLVFGGYPSITQKHEFAEWISDQAPQQILVLHFGDWNPSGEHMGTNFEETLRRYRAKNFTFTRAALTEQQIKRFKLITRPAKDTDVRTPNFSGKVCCDLDALTKAQLQDLVRACLKQQYEEQVERNKDEQEAERAKLRKYAAALTTAARKILGTDYVKAHPEEDEEGR